MIDLQTELGISPAVGIYKIVSDIDASETQEWNVRKGVDPIGEFTGELDENGHTIEGIHIDRTSSANNGIFSQIREGSVIETSVSTGDVKLSSGGSEV